jgi:hypothetical protein
VTEWTVEAVPKPSAWACTLCHTVVRKDDSVTLTILLGGFAEGFCPNPTCPTRTTQRGTHRKHRIVATFRPHLEVK